MDLPLYFEDLALGMRFETAGATLTEDAVIRFGLEWDFQPFHVDREAAADSIFGGLIASGLHTLVMSYRLFNQLGVTNGTALAGLGMDRIRWHAPVHAGDTLRVRASIGSLRSSGSKSDRGVVVWHLETLNQRAERVFTAELAALVKRRHEREA
jgi:acyl dehydratase